MIEECKFAKDDHVENTGPYNIEEFSDIDAKEEMSRERAAACKRLREEASTERLWEAIVSFSGYPFYTAKGLRYTYTVKGNELFVSRKEKSITRSSVNMAFHRAMDLGGIVGGPKKLGVFGASYLYPIFIRLGIIQQKSSLQSADKQ